MKRIFRYVICLLALASIHARADYQSTIDAHSPLRYYGFREASGTTATDRGSQLIDGTYSGGFTLGSTGANFGHTAVTLNGTSGGMDIGTLALNGRTTLTIEGWIRMTAASDYQSFFSEAVSNTDRLELLTGAAPSVLNGTGALVIAYGEGSAGNLLYTGSVFTVGTWHHVAVVYNGALSGNARFAAYVDGVAKTLTAFNSNTPNPTLGLTNTTAYVGKSLSSATFWKGDLQDIAIIPAALSSGQVAADYAARDVSSSLASGTLSNTALGTTTATNVSTAATGGTSPYSYQWQRRSPAGSGSYANVGGATSLTLNDTGLSPSTSYGYRVISTDSASATVNSSELSITTATPSTSKKVLFIGDSLTYGSGASGPPGTIVATQLTTLMGVTHTAINQGVPSSTTLDWVAGGTNMNAADAAVTSAGGVDVVMITLGTNDSNSGNAVAAATYRTRLSGIAAHCVATYGAQVIINYPPSYGTAGTTFAYYDATALARLQTYFPQIDSLANGTTIFRGDTQAFDYFIANPSEHYSDLVHFNDTGNASLAGFWANAYLGVFGPSVSASVSTNGAQITLTYGAAVTGVSASDYWLTVDGAAINLGAVTGSGTSRVFSLGRRWVAAGSTVKLRYAATATVTSSGGVALAKQYGSTVTNNSVITKQQTDYVGRGLGVFLHYGINTFNATEWSDGSLAASTYQPTAFNPAQWAAVGKSLGATYMVFTSMHHDGFKQWASSEPYNCTESAYWVANYGSAQPLKLYMDATRAAGMAVGVYLSIWDRHWESTHPSFTARQYTDSVKTKISEIFALGKVDLLWTDGWGWGTSSSGVLGAYTGVIFSEVYAHIKSLNPNCLLVENSHEHTLAHTDIDIYEVPYEGQIPSSNFLTAENADTISLDGTWFWKSDLAATKTSSSIITTVNTTRTNRGAFLLNIPPSPSGQINTGFARTAAEVGATVSPTAPEYKVQTTTTAGARAFAY